MEKKCNSCALFLQLYFYLLCHMYSNPLSEQLESLQYIVCMTYTCTYMYIKTRNSDELTEATPNSSCTRKC